MIRSSLSELLCQVYLPGFDMKMFLQKKCCDSIGKRLRKSEKRDNFTVIKILLIKYSRAVGEKWSAIMAVVELKNDDWGDLKVRGPEGNVGDIGVISAPGELISDGYAGKQDPVDYVAFTLDHAAGLSFKVSADDAAKFTIYSLVPKTDKTSSSH